MNVFMDKMDNINNGLDRISESMNKLCNCLSAFNTCLAAVEKGVDAYRKMRNSDDLE